MSTHRHQKQKTLGEYLDENRGFGPGFDLLRITLAVLILAWHAVQLTGNDWLIKSPSPLWAGSYLLVPSFFAISGFLISASAFRLSLKQFLLNRALRIVPALAVDVAFSALIIGPILTSYALHKYFTEPQVYEYFLNVLGYVHYYLPGVFEGRVHSQVNGPLWTVPYEIGCYALIAALILSKLYYKKFSVLIATISYMSIGLVLDLVGEGIGHDIKRFYTPIFINRESQVITAFLIGLCFYQFRYHIPYRRSIALFCFLVCATAPFTLERADISHVGNRFVVLPALIYFVIYIGASRLNIPRWLSAADYSYGTYLYHWPILQTLLSFIPLLGFEKGMNLILLLFVGIPIVIAFAAFSWTCVERPILGLRKRFSFVARVRI